MKMKKLLQKAVVYAVAASMLVATPLTASAGLRGVYSVSDGYNDDIEKDGDKSHTGTVTTTDTNTSVLGDNDAKIIGIVLDQSTVSTYVGVPEDERPQLTATIVLDGKITKKVDGKDVDITDEVAKQISDKIKWKVTNLDGTTDPDKAGRALNETLSITAEREKDDDGKVTSVDRTVVTLNPRRGTKYGNLLVTASIGGAAKYDYKYIDEDGVEQTGHFDGTSEVYSASAEVFIKEYTTGLSLRNPGSPQYVKHTVDMTPYLDRVSDTANDTITWSVKPGITGAATISDAGVVTIKKYSTKAADVEAGKNTVTVIAISERGLKAETTFDVDPGVAADKVEIKENGTTITKRTIDLGGPDLEGYREESIDVTAVMTRKDGNNDGITDVIKWSNNKPAIVELTENDENATLKALAVGTAKITATASGGKKATLTVTVKATLNGLDITTEDCTLYSGQTLQMEEEKRPEQSKDAVTWSIKKVAKNPEEDPDDPNTKLIANPNATINGKGVLTIKNTINPNYPDVIVEVRSKSKVVVGKDANGKDVKDYIYGDSVCVINVEQSSVDIIEVTDDTNTPIARVNVDNSKDKVTGALNTTYISVPKNRTYKATAIPALEDGTDSAKTLAWKTSSAKVATVEPNGDGTAKIKAVGKGTATITVSGIHATYKDDGSVKSTKAIKVTFKVSVKQPVTSLTMNTTSVVLKTGVDKNKHDDTTKDLKTTLSVKANKNAKADVDWTYRVIKEGQNHKDHTIASPKVTINNGKVTIEKNTYASGDVIRIIAKDKETGVKATADIKIISPSKSVAILNASGDEFKYTNTKDKEVKKATVLDFEKPLVLYPTITLNDGSPMLAGTTGGGTTVAGVTYTVNKKGIVQIEGNTVYRLKEGSVVITAKTDDGKTYKLTIDDVSKAKQ